MHTSFNYTRTKRHYFPKIISRNFRVYAGIVLCIFYTRHHTTLFSLLVVVVDVLLVSELRFILRGGGLEVPRCHSLTLDSLILFCSVQSSLFSLHSPADRWKICCYLLAFKDILKFFSMYFQSYLFLFIIIITFTFYFMFYFFYFFAARKSRRRQACVPLIRSVNSPPLRISFVYRLYTPKIFSFYRIFRSL